MCICECGYLIDSALVIICRYGFGECWCFAPLGGSKGLNTPLANCGLILKRGYDLHNNERDEPNTAFTLPLETEPEWYCAKNCTVLAAYWQRLHCNY